MPADHRVKVKESELVKYHDLAGDLKKSHRTERLKIGTNIEMVQKLLGLIRILD